MTYFNRSKDPQNQRLPGEYQKLRERIHELEKLIEKETNEKTAKRLDKAVTVLKVGAKIIKKTLKDDDFITKPEFKIKDTDKYLN